MFLKNFAKFIKYYGKGRKIKLFGFFLLSLIAGFLEFAGISLIYPFILLIIQPSTVTGSKYYHDFAAFLHIQNVLTNAFILGLIVTLLFITKNLFMIFILYLQNKFLNNWKLAINKMYMHYYLFSSYKNSLETPSSEKIYNLNYLVNQTLTEFIFRIINLITNSSIIFMILILLFLKFFFAAFITSVFIIVSMIFQNKFFKGKVKAISQEIFKFSKLTNRKILECIENLKEIKILSAEDYFYGKYLNIKKKDIELQFVNGFYETIPPYIVEILVVLALVILAGIISIQNIDKTSWMIASYIVVVAAVFRIAPTLNRVQSAINGINTSRDYVRTMISEFEKNDLYFIEETSNLKIKFENRIKLEDVYFTYKKNPVIKNLNLEIKKGEFVGIIGHSGAGKSTLADIIMGLLPVDSGKIFVDDLELTPSTFNALRKLIGYVPQQINILEGTFKENIAFGIEERNLSERKIIEALKDAQIYDFVKSFEDGINSEISSGATGLSQGQKQRLAIARALYRESELLIFDEATSSLDVETEHEITKMLSNLKGQRTIIAIAHRLSTLKSCDRLVYLKDGRIIDTGTFEELSHKYPDFEKLIKLSNINNA